MNIDRVSKISKSEFLENYLRKNVPMVVTDAMNDWNLNRFHPDSLRKEFGKMDTQIYDDLFDLQNINSLEEYFDANFGKPNERCTQYVRWYTKLRDVDFVWSDEIFDALKDSWSHPYFLPTSSLVVPFCAPDQTIDITTSRFPYKGLFISGKGARTRLHRDPFNSNAILCQFYGEKEVILYPPDQAPYVMRGTEYVDAKSPDLNKFSSFHNAKPSHHFILKPGEMIFFPGGWFHDVACVTDSISITWNFVHTSGTSGFLSHLKANPKDDQLEIVKFFMRDWLPATASADDICNVVDRKFAVLT